jgi:hypothetical protein
VKLVVCESIAAITTHLRDAEVVEPNYGGHHPRPAALCGSAIAWDTKLPLGAARCRPCLDAAKQLGWKP